MAEGVCIDEALGFEANDVEIAVQIRGDEDIVDDGSDEEASDEEDDDEIQVIGKIRAETKTRLSVRAQKTARPGDDVYVFLKDGGIDWQRATFVVNVIDDDDEDKIEVELKDGTVKILSKCQIASGCPTEEGLLVADRVLFENWPPEDDDEDEAEAASRPKFCTGFVTEVPSAANKQRYLVFMETDDTARYFPPGKLHLTFGYPKTISEYFLKSMESYIRRGPERLLLAVRPGHSTHVAVQGVEKLKYVVAEVLEVDCSVALFRQVEAKKTEWIWRGSKRLWDIKKTYDDKRKIRKDDLLLLEGKGSGEPGKKKPKLVKDDPEAEEDQKKPNIKYLPRGRTARKSTRAFEINPESRRHETNFHPAADEVVNADNPKNGIVVRRELKAMFDIVQLLEENQSGADGHECKVLCAFASSEKGDPSTMNEWLLYLKRAMELGLLDWPRLFGFGRTTYQLTSYPKRMAAGRRRRRNNMAHRWAVEYKAPCGRVLKSAAEVHDFLMATESMLSIDMFSFDHEVDPRREFVANEQLARLGRVPICDKEKPYMLAWKDEQTGQLRMLKKSLKKDFTEGSETLPIHWVDSTDNNSKDPTKDTPQLVNYLQEIEAKGVNMNSDPHTFRSCCDCTDGCKEWKSCACRRLTNETAKKPMNKILRDVTYKDRRLRAKVATGIFECNPDCACAKHPQHCLNRVAQNDPSVKLELFLTEGKGWGVRVLQDTPKGTVVCRYTGELLPDKKANEDGRRFDDKYFLELDYIDCNEEEKEGYEEEVVDPEGDEASSSSSDESGDQLGGTGQRGMNRKPSKQAISSSKKKRFKLGQVLGAGYVVDSLKAGNIGRFFNHSCDPNLFLQTAFVSTHDPRFPQVALFTSRVVKAGEELCWSYGYKVHDSTVEYEGEVRLMECLCGAPNCGKTFVLSGTPKEATADE